jgi:DNA polymerase-3 subunit gamma/tau
MSSLYLKHRPNNFDDVIGNEDIVSYLQEIAATPEKAPQTFLLHGPTGCGKTTLARIFATEIGCAEIDLKEIDTADFRGIDTAREIIKRSKYKSMGGDYRVWLIDECHKLTKDAQNALLKTLEDTPKGAFFILCTTEPENLIKPIRSRCIDLQVRKLNDTEMNKLLKRTVKQESDTKLRKEVYELIIEDSKGHPRNALQTLEKVLQASPDKQLEVAEQVKLLETTSFELCRALMEQNANWKKVREILKGLENAEAEGIRRHVLGYAKSVLLSKDLPRAALIIEEFWEPLYNVGYPGLVYMCYSVVKS